MEYETAGQASDMRLGQSVTQEPHLSRLTPLAASVEESIERIQHFIGRFRGGGIKQGEDAKTAPMPSGHLAQIQRLNDASALLAKLTVELNSIG